MCVHDRGEGESAEGEGRWAGSGNGMASFMGRGQQRRVLMLTVSFKVSGMLLVRWAKRSRG